MIEINDHSNLTY